MHRLISSLIVLCCSLLLLAPAYADKTIGPVILTVAGNITNANRGPLDDFKDAYFNTQDVEFDKARVFDVIALEALGMQQVSVSYPDWPKAFEFEGPLLSDVLKAAGAQGSLVSVKALDGYAPEIEISELEKYPVILALKKDGQYLGLGDRGPAWVIYPRNDYPELAEEDDAKFVWAVYFIEVK